MKYLILILAATVATLHIRVQVNSLAKGMYVEGCMDSSLKLEKIGKSEESETIKKFCKARQEMLDQNMDSF